jgi:hypothetical protein
MVFKTAKRNPERNPGPKMPPSVLANDMIYLTFLAWIEPLTSPAKLGLPMIEEAHEIVAVTLTLRRDLFRPAMKRPAVGLV